MRPRCTPLRPLLLVLLVPASMGCGKGLAGETLRPEAKSAAEALGESEASFDCTQVAPAAEPLIVDWPDQDRMNLALALGDSVAVVHYGCDGLRLVKHCSLPGTYTFAGAQLMSNVIELASEDAVQASLPVQGATFSAKVRGASKIDVATAIIGRKGTLVSGPSAAELSGECEGATHYVRAAYVGAFRVATGTEGEARAAVEIFGAGASGQSSSTQAMLSTDGDFDACQSYEPGSPQAPGNCQSAVRLEIMPIAKRATPGTAAPEPKETDPLTNVCPAGTVVSGGACAPKSAVTSFRCNPSDVEECRAQCELGNADSCFNTAQHMTKPVRPGQPGSGAEAYNKRRAEAFPLYDKACAGGVSRACLAVASSYAYGVGVAKDGRKADALLNQVCFSMLDPMGCSNLAAGYQFGSGDRKKNIKKAESLYTRACDLGSVSGCGALARLYLDGKDMRRNAGRGMAILERSCVEARQPSPCETLSRHYREGKVVKKDKAKAKRFHAKACAQGLKSKSCG